MLESFRRYWALTRKEFQQLQRNKKLMVQLTIPPTLLLIVLGYALNPDVKDLRVGIVDHDRSRHSRDLIASLEQVEAFGISGYYLSEEEAEEAMSRRALDLLVIIPPDLAKRIERGQAVDLQVIADAVIANSAAVAGGYVRQIVAQFSRRLAEQSGSAGLQRASSPALGPGADSQVEVRTTALYNPGLIFSWFYLTGIMAVVMFVDGSLVASAIAVREKEVGTVEQLLMSPAQSLEIILAKTTPVLGLLVLGLLIARITAYVWFGLPLRGSLALFVLTGALAGLSAMGLGILIATFSDNQQQSQLLTFFVNPPIVFFSGAFARIENMPEASQWCSLFVPLRYFVELVRGITLKGLSIELLWLPLLTLAAMTLLLYAVSAWRFRNQLN